MKDTIQSRFYGDTPEAKRFDAQRRACQKAGIDQRKAKKNRRDWE